MSHESPCSVPEWLRIAYPLETETQQLACRWHDYKYAQGGSHRHRLYVDIRFLIKLIKAGMDVDTAEKYFWAVRQYGGVFWNGFDWPGSRPEHHDNIQAGG